MRPMLSSCSCREGAQAGDNFTMGYHLVQEVKEIEKQSQDTGPSILILFFYRRDGKARVDTFQSHCQGFQEEKSKTPETEMMAQIKGLEMKE